MNCNKLFKKINIKYQTIKKELQEISTNNYHLNYKGAR